MLIIYNFPPWLCMKRKFTFLILLISGPRQPGNDINVYLAPLIYDLNTLWNGGVQAYDAYKKETLNLKAMLLWIVNDFLHMEIYLVSLSRAIKLVQFVMKELIVDI